MQLLRCFWRIPIQLTWKELCARTRQGQQVKMRARGWRILMGVLMFWCKKRDIQDLSGVGFDSFVFHWYSSGGDRNIMKMFVKVLPSTTHRLMIAICGGIRKWSWFPLPIMLQRKPTSVSILKHVPGSRLGLLVNSSWNSCEFSMEPNIECGARSRNGFYRDGHSMRSLGQCFLVDEGHSIAVYRCWFFDGLLGLKLRICFQLARRKRSFRCQKRLMKVSKDQSIRPFKGLQSQTWTSQTWPIIKIISISFHNAQKPHIDRD